MTSQKKRVTRSQRKKEEVTTAIHVHSEDGAEHVVGIGNLRVMLFNDDGSWFAQGLEIDYFAQGSTLKEAQKNFHDGLTATIDYHLREHGTIRGILQTAPRETWEDFLANGALSKRYFRISWHDSLEKFLPFAGVDFYERTA